MPPVAPAAPTGNRRLAAVMFLDMVGYSGLMARDEARALGFVRELEGVVRAQVPATRGRLVKFLGDGSMAEFPTAAAAVACALGVQQAVAARNADAPADARFALRVGLHLGDLIEESGDLFGDAVNIAARIQPLADPGGIAMSATVHEQVKGHTALRGTFVRVRLKNIPKRASVFLVPPPAVGFAGWWVRKHRRALLAAAASLGLAGLAAWGGSRLLRTDAVLVPVENLVLRSTFYAGKEGTAWVDSDGGPEGAAARVTLGGNASPEGYAGMVAGGAEFVNYGDWSRFSALRFSVMGAAGGKVRLCLVEKGVKNPAANGELWVRELELPPIWTKVTVPFASFVKNAGYQAPDQDNNGLLDLKRMLQLSLEHSASSTALESFSLGRITLVTLRANRPPGAPVRPAGPSGANAWSQLTFTTRAEDPDGEAVSLELDWGDGTAGKAGPVESGKPLPASHAWKAPGEFAVRARALDPLGGVSAWSEPAAVKIAAGGDVVLEDFETLQNVVATAGNGARSAIEPAPGNAGPGGRVSYAGGGSKDAYWTVAKRAADVNGGDWSAYGAVRVSVRSTDGRQLTLRLVERGVKNPETEGEYWVRQFTPTGAWTTYTFRFAEFTSGVSWQPDDADKDKRLDLGRVLQLQFAMDNPAAAGSFDADDLTLVAGPSGLPPRAAGAAKPAKPKRK